MRGFSALFSGYATGKRRLARCLKSADWKSRALAGSASSHHHLQERKTPSTRAAASSPRLKRRHLRSCESPPWHTAVIRTTQVEQGLSCISSRQNREPQVGATARAPRSGSGSVCPEPRKTSRIIVLYRNRHLPRLDDDGAENRSGAFAPRMRKAFLGHRGGKTQGGAGRKSLCRRRKKLARGLRTRVKKAPPGSIRSAFPKSAHSWA
jgi:hypothetical protein